MNLKYVIALILILIAIAGVIIYEYKYIKRVLKTIGRKVEKRSVKIAIGIVAAVIFVWSVMSSIMLMFLIHFVVSSMIVDFIRFVYMKVRKDKSDNKLSKVFNVVYGFGVIPIVITCAIIIYGYFNMMNVVRTNYTLNTDKKFSIEEDGEYRVALIADVHYGISLDDEKMKLICDEISGCNPDIVVLCGDIVDENSKKEEMEYVFSTLGKIQSKYGIFYVYGNHDRQLYNPNKAYTLDEIENAIKQSGITILQDEAILLNDEFVVFGREDAGYNKDKGRTPVAEILANIDSSIYKLGLDHQPKNYDENAEAEVDLLLSGHTHGGQIWPANYLFEIVKFDDAVYGLIEDGQDNFNAIVTSGLAGWGYTIKTASPAEYVIIDIKGR